MTDTLALSPGSVSLEQLERIYRDDVAVVLDDGCRDAVERAAERVARAAAGDAAIYGVNTGFGKLASTRIAADHTAELQRNLIRSHCCGVGEPLPREVVRLVIALKMASLGRGASGVRFVLIERLGDLLARDIMPVIPAQGSVGASGASGEAGVPADPPEAELSPPVRPPSRAWSSPELPGTWETKSVSPGL